MDEKVYQSFNAIPASAPRTFFRSPSYQVEQTVRTQVSFLKTVVTVVAHLGCRPSNTAGWRCVSEWERKMDISYEYVDRYGDVQAYFLASKRSASHLSAYIASRRRAVSSRVHLCVVPRPLRGPLRNIGRHVRSSTGRRAGRGTSVAGVLEAVDGAGLTGTPSAVVVVEEQEARALAWTTSTSEHVSPRFGRGVV